MADILKWSLHTDETAHCFQVTCIKDVPVHVLLVLAVLR